MEMTITETQPTRALLVEADTGDYDAEASLEELFELAKSEGIELNDEQIAAISGGQSWHCDTYVYHECKDDYSPGRC